MRAILGRKDFRRLLVSRVTSQLADGYFQAGLAVSVFFDPTKRVQPLSYAIGFAILVAPYSILGPYVGVFLDRWSRRNILAVSNLVRSVLVLPAALLILLDGPVWTYGIFALGIMTINRFVLAGLSAAQPHVVEPAHLVTANSFATTAGTVFYGTGLGSSYVVILLIKHLDLGGGSLRYAVTALVALPLYAISAAVAWRSFRVEQLGPDETERAGGRVIQALVDTTRGMIAGFRHLWQRRGAAYSMTVQAGHRALYGVLAVYTLAIFRGHFHNPRITDFADTLAWLAGIATAGQAGSFLAALVTPWLTRRIGPQRWVSALLVLVTLTVASLGFNVEQYMFVAGTFAINIVSQSIKIVTDTSLQSSCEDEYRGRLFSLNDTVFNFAFIVGMFVGASVLPADGRATWLLFATTAGYVLLTGWYVVAGTRYPPYRLR
ncbi:MAG TPA: MFS transporter [Stackebrandtia sp.]|uniref:MFS transporter n=1 Tax=Stackebrandtia sp. TaxID=2023065 RepID=UPI002D2F7C96|nr:MFS transporter [Stackebrandtia sp.]HZE40771.1 MFS transporter [Stackebrandtia sp.]